MTGQWEPYVEAAAKAQERFWAPLRGRSGYPDEIDFGLARAVLAVVGPLIAEDTRVRMVEAAAEIVKREEIEDAAVALLQDFIDPDPCWYDHHGYCQAHGWLDDDPACPHKRARELLAERGIEVES